MIICYSVPRGCILAYNNILLYSRTLFSIFKRKKSFIMNTMMHGLVQKISPIHLASIINIEIIQLDLAACALGSDVSLEAL
ncbi:hypothetical protein XELAEV_18045132mg [Xenopus laevis]|uniref:Uncharacterized protein n=1 Tax=Xenopus laevis TaxID=8355 RepID=A0A974C046_XENLA|nr:hypothetical protein XELAEV_18045132mg [Xenopus laevis]